MCKPVLLVREKDELFAISVKIARVKAELRERKPSKYPYLQVYPTEITSHFADREMPVEEGVLLGI
jgi:hypothetical protein